MKSTAAPLGKTFAQLTKGYVGALSAKLAHLDIDRHFYLLHLISVHEGQLTQKQLAEMIFQDKSAMVRIIDYLSEKGYVRRIQNPSDRREHFVELTSKAEAIIDDISHAFKELDEDIVNNLSADQLSCLNKCLTTISGNLEAMPSKNVKLNFKRTRKDAVKYV